MLAALAGVASTHCLALLTGSYYIGQMKTFTIRLPEPLVAEIEAESQERRISKSDVVRERLQIVTGSTRHSSPPLDGIADLIGSVESLPADLSARKKHYLKATGYGQKRPR